MNLTKVFKKTFFDKHNGASKGLKQEKCVTKPQGLRQLNILP